MEKVKVLFNAYLESRNIEPFTLDETEALEIQSQLRRLLIEKEGFAGYKISSSAIGVLTKEMVKTIDTIKLRYPEHIAEIEVIARTENCQNNQTGSCIRSLHIGVELPATRFSKYGIGRNYSIADNASASLLFVGPEIENKSFELVIYRNDEKIGNASPKYEIADKLKWLFEKEGSFVGYAALGKLINQFIVKRGDIIRVEGDVNFTLKLI